MAFGGFDSFGRNQRPPLDPHDDGCQLIGIKLGFVQVTSK